MFHIKLSIRRLLRNKTINSFSIIGFFLSFVLLTVIFQYVVSEIRVDSYHKNRDQIYTLSMDGTDAWVSTNLLDILKDESLIEKVIPYAFAWDGVLIKNGNNESQFVESIFVDSAFFQSFSFEFTQGNKENAVIEPFTAVLTESESKKLFGNENPIGKVIDFNNEHKLTITGIIKDYPRNSIFRSQCFISYNTTKTIDAWTFKCGWNCRNHSAFVKLRKPEDADLLAIKISEIIKKETGDEETSAIIPIKEIYFNKDFRISIREELTKGDLGRVYIFALLGLIILFVATFNYLNFIVSNIIDSQQSNATLKVFGGKFRHFFKAYFSDTIITFTLSLSLSYIFYYFIGEKLLARFDLFQGVAVKPLSFILPLLCAFVIAVLSSIMAALWVKRERVLKIVNQRRQVTRKAILVVQFCSVVFLVVTCFLVNKQVNFMQNKSLGFNKENLICLNTNDILKSSPEVIRNELIKIPGVKDVSFSDAIPGRITQGWGTTISVDGEDKDISFRAVPAESHFLDVFGYKLISGRFYSDTIASDKYNVVINKSTADYLGWENPVGKMLLDGWFNGEANGEIVGVVEDFHFSSLHSKIEPLVFINSNNYEHYITLKVASGYENQLAIVNELEKQWKILEADIPFNWFYFDDHLNSLYKKEKEFSQLTVILTAIAIIITILGLLGMITFILKQRIKEIGIRKVNGAKPIEIINLFNNDFNKWVLVSIVLAIPISFLFLNNWLENFAYKTTISWWIFLAAGVLTITVSIITISWQTFRATRKNPVEALRYE